MLAILNFLNAHNLPIFQPILMILVSKFMVHRAPSDKTHLSFGLLSPLSRWVGFIGFYQTIKYQNFVCSLKILMFLFSITHTSIFHVLILPIEFSRTAQRSR